MIECPDYTCTRIPGVQRDIVAKRSVATMSRGHCPQIISLCMQVLTLISFALCTRQVAPTPPPNKPGSQGLHTVPLNLRGSGIKPGRPAGWFYYFRRIGPTRVLIFGRIVCLAHRLVFVVPSTRGPALVACLEPRIQTSYKWTEISIHSFTPSAPSPGKRNRKVTQFCHQNENHSALRLSCGLGRGSVQLQ